MPTQLTLSTTARGRLRLDAIARYMQDIATDDVEEAGVEDPEHIWVVRRTAIHIVRWPVYEEWIDVATWAGGAGPRWATRRTRLTGSRGGQLETASVWVHLTRSPFRPAPLPSSFRDVYGEAAGGRLSSQRFSLPVQWQPPGQDRPWGLREADVDILGHINNAIYWQAIEDVIAADSLSIEHSHAEIEFRRPIRRVDAITLRTQTTTQDTLVWFMDGDSAAATARIATQPAVFSSPSSRAASSATPGCIPRLSIRP